MIGCHLLKHSYVPMLYPVLTNCSESRISIRLIVFQMIRKVEEKSFSQLRRQISGTLSTRLLWKAK